MGDDVSKNLMRPSRLDCATSSAGNFSEGRADVQESDGHAFAEGFETFGGHFSGFLENGLVSQKFTLLNTHDFYLNLATSSLEVRHPENKPLFKTPGLRLVLEGFTWFVHESWRRDRNLTAADRESPGESGSRASSSCCPRSRFRLCFHDSWSSGRCRAKCSYHHGATSGGGL